jgi:pentose-5-phosphate-3-epimerase
MTQVLPAIIPRTKEELENEINFVAGFANLVQVDISDGVFTSVKTWPYNGRDTDFFEDLKTEKAGWPQWEKVDIELHLMVQNPESVVEDWIHTGVSGIVAHIEATENFQKVIDLCRELNVSIGVAIKPKTDIAQLAPYVDQVDFIQVMGSDMLGKHHITLEDMALEKIKALRLAYPEKTIAVDIGVSEETAETLVSAGANKLVSGGAILNSENPVETYRYLTSIS